MKRVIFLLAIGIIMSITMVVFAVDEGAMYVSIQTTLIDANGEPFISGLYDLQFKIFKDLMDNTVLWSDKDEDIPVTAGGILNYELGWVSASVFAPESESDDGIRYVQVFTFDGSEALSDRVKISDISLSPVATGVKATASSVPHTKSDTPSETIMVPLMKISNPPDNNQRIEKQIRILKKRIQKLEALAQKFKHQIDSLR